MSSRNSILIARVMMFVCLMILGGPLCFGGVITGISIPVGSLDGSSHPVTDNVYSVGTPPYPLNINLGIGYLLNPTVTTGSGHTTSNLADFTLHDHVYIQSNVPDPNRVIVTYQFNVPTVVKGVEIVNHLNGVTRIEGFSGNTLGSLTSIGSVFGSEGDATGEYALNDGSHDVFDFGNTSVGGTYFQFNIRKTSEPNDWALYRAYLLDANGNRIAPATAENVTVVPEPGTLALAAIGLVVGMTWLRRRRISAMS